MSFRISSSLEESRDDLKLVVFDPNNNFKSRYNVKRYGASGDLSKDDTDSFQTAINMCYQNGGGVVFIPSGRYLISGTVNVYPGVRLHGDTVNDLPDKVSNLDTFNGSVVYVNNLATTNQMCTFLLYNNCSIEYLSFYYPDQTHTEVPVEYKPTISFIDNVNNCCINNIFFGNSYIGIDIGMNHEHVKVQNISGLCIKNGIIVGKSTDVSYLSNIHLSQNTMFENDINVSTLSKWIIEHAETITLLPSSQVILSQLYSCGYNTTVCMKDNEDVTESSIYLQMKDCNVKMGRVGVHNQNMSVCGSIQNCNFTIENINENVDTNGCVLWYSSGIENSKEDLVINGCRFSNTGGGCIKIQNSKNIKINDNEFSESNHDMMSLINVENTIITNNIVKSSGSGIYVDEQSKHVIVSSNILKNQSYINVQSIHKVIVQNNILEGEIKSHNDSMTSDTVIVKNNIPFDGKGVNKKSNSDFISGLIDTSVSIRLYRDDYSAVGSGFIFKHEGLNPGLYVGTAAHCIMTDNDTRNNISTDVYVTIYNYNNTGKSRVFKCEIVGIAGYMDFAVLKIVDGVLNSHNYLQFETTDEHCKIGDSCYMCGNPLGYDALSYCDGSIRDNSYWFHYDIDFLSFSAPVYPGNSGSALLNSRGNIIGIVSYGMSGGDNFNFGAKYTHLSKAANYICSNKQNYVGGTLNCNLSPVEIVYLKHFNKIGNDASGYYIYSNQNSDLVDYHSIISINDEELGIFPNQSRPSIIYDNPDVSLSFKIYNPFSDSTFDKIIKVNYLSESQDVYMGHSTQSMSTTRIDVSNCKLIGPCKIDNETDFV